MFNVNTVANVSAVETNGVRTYWDSNCTNPVFSIDWGTLKPGSVKNVTLFFRNEENTPTFLIMATRNWDPAIASEYITLELSYIKSIINAGEIINETLTLSVSPHITGISNFSFDILIMHASAFAEAYGSSVGDPNYNDQCDFDLDGDVDRIDFGIFAQYYGVST
jgi:hypothetical protein